MTGTRRRTATAARAPFLARMLIWCVVLRVSQRLDLDNCRTEDEDQSKKARQKSSLDAGRATADGMPNGAKARAFSEKGLQRDVFIDRSL